MWFYWGCCELKLISEAFICELCHVSDITVTQFDEKPYYFMPSIYCTYSIFTFPFQLHCCYIETSPLICAVKQWTCFYTVATLCCNW